jgi:hypothetical protein
MRDILLNFDQSDRYMSYDFLDDGKERVLQQIKLAVNVWYGDWLLDDTIGVDYENNMRDKALIQEQIKRAILSVDGVSTITKFVFTEEYRSSQLVYVIQCSFLFDNDIVSISLSV